MAIFFYKKRLTQWNLVTINGEIRCLGNIYSDTV